MSFLDVVADFTTTALITAIRDDQMIIEWVEKENIDRALKVKLPKELQDKNRAFHDDLEGQPLSGASIEPINDGTGELQIALHFSDLTLNLRIDPKVLVDRSLDSESSTPKFDEFLKSGVKMDAYDFVVSSPEDVKF